MPRHLSLLAAVSIVSATAGSSAAWAQPAPDAAPAPGAPPAAEVDETGTPEPKHQLGGYVQGDGRFFLEDEADAQSDRFELRRVRPSFKGTLWDHYEYKFLVDFAGGRLQLLDAYVDVKYVPWAVLRLGQGKTPFGIERLESAADLKFVERALPTQLVPNRDIGVQLVGEVAGGILGYQVGIMDGVADASSIDVNEDDMFDLVGRVFAQPFKSTGILGLRGLGIGAAATRGERQGSDENPQIAPYRTAGGSTIFEYASPDPETMPVLADGEHLRVSGQGYLYDGPFGLLAEYVWSRQEVSAGELSGEFAHRAWAAAATVLVTGDDATYKAVEPKSPFDPLRGQWGALELGARYAQLDVDTDTFDAGLASADESAERARALTFGVTWYLNQVFKAQVNFERTTFDGGAPEGADRAAENALLARSQIAF